MDNHEQKAADKQAPKGVEDAAKESLECRRALMQEAIGKANDAVKKVVWGEKGNSESVFKLGFVGGYMSGHRDGRQANQLPGVEECIAKAKELDTASSNFDTGYILSPEQLENLINFSQGKTPTK